MKDKTEEFQFTTGVIGYPIAFVLVLWIVFWFEIRFNFDFNHLGVLPRTIVGLRGVVFSPFIHADLSHLWNNTLPVLILSASLFYFYAQQAWKVLWIGVLCTGVLTWLFGRTAHHIGASGVIYMLFGFLFFKGILTKHFRLIAVSLIVVFIYGSMIWYIAPIDPKISWEGHLSGLLTGIVLAFVFKKGIAQPTLYHWETEEYDPEEDAFLQHFDEEGNFVPSPPPPEEITDISDIAIVYDYKEQPKNISPPTDEEE